MKPAPLRNPVLEKYGIEPDPVIEFYKKDVDRTLLRENLKLTPDQRIEKFIQFARFADSIRGAARRAPPA